MLIRPAQPLSHLVFMVALAATLFLCDASLLRAQRLQVGAFANPDNLRRRVRLLEDMGVEVQLQSNAEGVTRVRTAPLEPNQKQNLSRRLKENNIPYIVIGPEPPPIREMPPGEPAPPDGDTEIERILPQPPGGHAVRLSDATQRRLERAMGTSYRWGGESLETGFDCSGLLVWLFPDPEIPRTVIRMWSWTRSIDRERLRPGDFVFFNFNSANRPDHVGLYLGGGRFVHASTTYGVIRAVLDKSYYQRNLYGYGRPPSFSS